MHLSRRIAALLAAALVAGAPAVAHAQGSAGDEQYQDPFGGATNGAGQKSGGSQESGSSGSGSSTPSPSSGSTGSSSSGTTSAPAPAPSSSSSAAAPAPTATSSGTRQELPRTGLDAPVIALLGLGLLAAGIGLRLRLRAVDGRR